MIHDDMWLLLGQVQESYVLRMILVYVTGDSGYTRTEVQPAFSFPAVVFAAAFLRVFVVGVVVGVGIR